MVGMSKTLYEPPEYLVRRPRRNRQSPAIRDLVQETRLHPSDFVVPLFIVEGLEIQNEISAMPGVDQFSIDQVIDEIRKLFQMGIRAVDLFPIIPPKQKNAMGSEALREGNLIETAVTAIKEEVPDMCVMVDVALDPYTDHGHDGILDDEGLVDNDATLDILAEMSLLAAEAGADVIAPSDMMDGRVAHIRHHLDARGFSHVGIISYAAKYASSLYGPFRDTLKSCVGQGNKKTYQMNPANIREALLECTLDELEGADMLMVKPALTYLDVIAKIKENTNLPVAAYHVSGEYSMVMAAAEKGWCVADKVFEEQLTAIKRAGADMIFTYAARQWLANQNL